MKTTLNVHMKSEPPLYMFKVIEVFNLRYVQPPFTLSHTGSDNSPLLTVFSANCIVNQIVTFMRLKVFRKL